MYHGCWCPSQAQSLDYATVTRSQWESELTNFLNDPANGRFKGDFVWQSGSTSTASMVRVRAFFIGMNEAEQEVEAMNSAKATVAAWASAYDVVGAFAYAPTFPSWALLGALGCASFVTGCTVSRGR